MKTHFIKDKYQYSISSSMIMLFSAPFIVWQMGVMYFSGNTMSLSGRMPIPISQECVMLAIVVGYIASIVITALFPRHMIYIQRALLPVALCATSLILLPCCTQYFSALFITDIFICVFSIGAMLSVAVMQFTVETTWRDGIISMIAGGILIAILQNDFFNVSFTYFMLFSLLFIALLIVFFYRLPAKIETPLISKKNKIKMPKILFAGIWLISGFATLLICFASTYAESIVNGVSVLYISAAIWAVVLYSLRNKFGVGSLRIFGIFFALAVFGFVLAGLSLYLPVLQYISCMLLGFIVVLANLWTYFAAASFQIYPTRFIGALGAGMGLSLALIHSGLLRFLREDTFLLYGIYAALSVALLLIYYVMEPYFTYTWNRRHDSDGITSAVFGKTLSKPALEGELARQDNPLSVLSEQERILAQLIFDGHTETSAAELMNISINTQKSYRKNIYAKLDIHSKRELFEIVKNSRYK